MDEQDRDKVFLQEQILKARNESQKIKHKLATASREYDVLYLQA